MRKRITITAFVFVFVLSVAIGVTWRTSAQQTKQDELTSRSRWEHSDDGWKQIVERRGKTEFTDDYKDVRDVTPGGYVRIEEEQRDGSSRRYEVRRDLGGQLTRTYYVNGQQRAIDDEARTWIAKIVLEAVRQGGIDADRRVQRILQQNGVAGVLAEIDQIRSDFAKRIYFEALVKVGNLNSAALQDVLRKSAAQISSDYEQAQLLIGIAPTLVGNQPAMGAFFEAVATIKSDYEHSRVLRTVLKKNPQNRELLLQVATSTKSIKSDYEKALALKEVAAMYLDDAALRGLFFQMIESIKSDYERRGVLSALVKNSSLSEEVLNRMLVSAASISSDYEKATFLLEVSRTYTGNTQLKDAFLKVVETIKSDYERGRVLSALLKNKQIG
jgi:uncharacterized protein YeeX (DUF496 family)